MESNKNVWDKNIPVEESSYINTEKIKTLNSNLVLNDKPTMIDLFSGAGGFSVGGEWAGFQTVLGTDYYESAINTWSVNHPNAIAVLADIRDLEPNFLGSLLSKVPKIDLITGGIPCQGFSKSNRKHNPEDPRNYLYLEFIKMINFFEPNFLIIENVLGMKETANGKFVKNIISDLYNLGYNVQVNEFNSADYGIPQKRKRLIYIGSKKKFGKVKIPKVTNGNKKT